MPWTTQAATVQYEEDIWIEEEDNTPVVQCSYDADQRGQNRERTFGRGRSRPGWDNQPRRSDQSSNWRDSAGVGRGRSRQSSGGGGGGGDDSDVMVVPAKDVGKIIGKGGSKIRELQDSSGARIHILRDDEDDSGRSDEAKIRLTGPSEIRHKAQMLIEELIYPPGIGCNVLTALFLFLLHECCFLFRMHFRRAAARDSEVYA
ncbi:putative ATP-dependent RNA helicase DDX53 [Ixodes scapularis]